MFHWNKKSEPKMKISEAASTLHLFSIKDKQIESFGMIFEGINSDEVRANFITAFRDSKRAEEPLVKFAQHFDCYELASVNKKTGIIAPYQNPKLCFSLESLKS